MIIKILLPVLTVTLGHGVWSADLDATDVNKQNVATLPSSRYRYNHPPEAESYQAIPVAIVYEETPHDGKVLKVSTHTKTNAPKENLAITEETTVTTSENNDDDVEVKPKNDFQNKMQKSLKLKTGSENALQIPVAIVYDEPNTARSVKRNNKVNKSREQVRGFMLRKLQDQPSESSTIKTEVTTQNKDATNAVATSIELIKPQRQNGNRTLENIQTKIAEKTEETREAADKIKTNKNVSQGENNKPQLDSKDVSKFPKRNGTRDPVVRIIESENHVYAQTGDFTYSYEGGDGTKAFSKGTLKSFEDDKTGEAVEGGFSYKDKEGNDFSLSYTADENGYRPVGAHLPTPPPIPIAIARALRYLATKTTPEPVTEPSSESTKAHGSGI